MRALLLALVACGGSQPAPIAGRAAPPPDAPPASTGLPPCYPYVAAADGTCQTRCDGSKPHGEQGCHTGDWPLRCNSDGTCTPEHPPDHH